MPVKRSPLPKKDILERSVALKKKKKIGLVFLWSLLGLFMLAGAIYLIYCRALSIQTVTVQGNSVLDSSTISAFVENALAGKYWKLFPKKSIFIYPQERIETELLAEFPRLAEADLGLGGTNELVATVRERDSDVVWCAGEITASSSAVADDCYFADDQGLVFAPAPRFAGSVFTELHGALPLEPLGKYPLPLKSYETAAGFAKLLPKVFEKAAHENFRLVAVLIKTERGFEALIADSSKDASWKIIFDADETADELAGNLYAILESAAFRKEFIDHQGLLESIDLRYGKKVYYKFKD